MGVRGGAARPAAVHGGAGRQPGADVHRVAQPVPEEHLERRPGRAGALGLLGALLLLACGRLPRALSQAVARRPVLSAGALSGGEAMRENERVSLLEALLAGLHV